MKPLHEVSTVETPEQIDVDLPLAGLGSRALAYIIDLLWQLVPIVAAIILVIALLPSGVASDKMLEGGEPGQEPRLTLLAIAILSAVFFFVNFGYFAAFEIFWQGQTPGKRSLGLRVLRDGGYPLDGRSALVRNFMRVVDFLPAFYGVGIATVFLGRSGKRVGDYAAGTIVVHERTVARGARGGAVSEGSGPYRTRTPQAPLSAQHRQLIEGFLSRRDQLTYEARVRLAREIADVIAQQQGHARPIDAERFLEQLTGRADTSG